MVNNIPAAGESASGGQGAVGRDENTLQQSFPFSPLYFSSAGRVSGGANFDESSKYFYKEEVLDNVRSFGYGINNFDADYTDAPDVRAVPDGSTSDGGAALKTIAVAKDVTAPVGSEYWPMPKPSEIGDPTGQVYEFADSDAGYGVGSGTGDLGNPSTTSAHISAKNPLSPGPTGEFS